ncbi:MAG: hypothetical protein ACLQVF_44915 [Isosphaeraceae bacterium]
MAVELTHVGEAIVAEMIESLRFRFIDLCGLSRRADSALYQSDLPIVSANVALYTYSGVGFDGASCVDLVVLLNEGLGVPFEVKLGETRLTKSRIDSEWLNGCGLSHENKRFRGSMMSVLERKFPAHIPPDALKVRVDGRTVTLTEEWFVITRQRILDGWTGSAKPAFSSKVQFLPFEAIVREFGGRESFNAMVSRLLAIDYYAAWVATN